MKHLRTGILFAATCAAAFGDTLVVPNNQATTSGNFPIPLSTKLNRIQEVVGGGQFPGALKIVALRVRAAPGAGPVSINFTARVTLSTTQAFPNTNNGHMLPSTTYANNVGPDATVVFNGTVSGSSPGCPSPGPCPMDLVIPFTTSFSFDPSKGRLLIDLVPSEATGTDSGSLDGILFTDSTSSTVAVVTGNASNPAGTLTIGGFVFGLDSAAQPPTIDSNGVHSVANGSTTNPPGSLVYATGTNMASTTLVASATPLTMEMQTQTDDVTVAVNGQNVPMYYITPNAVSFQLPWETGTGSATLVVTRNGVASNTMQFNVSEFSPGIYTTNGVGTGGAWAIFAATSKLNPKAQVAQPSNVGSYIGGAATAGDLLYIYAGGVGPAKNAVDGHAPCPLANNVPGACPAGYNASNYSTNTTPVILVDGINAKVNASILDPTYPGLYLVFFTVPAGTPKGNAVALQIQIGGVTTANNVTIAVQ